MYTLTHHRCSSLESRIQTILSSYQASLTSPSTQSLLDAPPSPIVRAFDETMPHDDLFAEESLMTRLTDRIKEKMAILVGYTGMRRDADLREVDSEDSDEEEALRESRTNAPSSGQRDTERNANRISLLDRRRYRTQDARASPASPLPASLRASIGPASPGTNSLRHTPLPKHHHHTTSSSLLHTWEKRRKNIREFADRFPNVAAIFEVQRLISKQIKDQLEELLLIALQCSEALDYYSALRYRSMMYRLTHTTPWHWFKQLGRWVTSKKTLSVAQEEMDKASALEQLLDEICTRIGELNCELLNRFDNVSTVDEAYDVLVHFSLFVNDTYLRMDNESDDSAPNIESVRDVLAIIDEYERYHVDWIAEKRKRLKECQVPSYISRHWIYYTTLTMMSFGVCRYLYNNYDTLQPMVVQSADIVWQNVNQRLLVPMKEAYHILRFEDRQNMIDAHKLVTSRETLAHMVQNYLRDTSYGGDMQLYVRKAYDGDISPVMENYTQHIRSPILCAVSTPLITEMLIQMQSLQVDMLKIMSGIGDVMTSNALNVELMALMPLVILASGISLSIVLYQKNQDSTVQSNIKDHLLAMDKIINANLHAIGGLSAREHGKVFFHSSCSLMHSTTVYDQLQQKTLFADFMELNSPELSMVQKHNVVQRIFKFIQYSRGM